jgi:ubiquitin-protein ligase
VQPFTRGSNRWTWSPGNDVPDSPAGHFNIPMLSDDLTHIPDELRCPISQDVMVDAVKAKDQVTYSRHALQQWFAIRKSSPLHGTTLSDTTMINQPDITRNALQWIEGHGLVGAPSDIEDRRPSKRRRSANASELITLNFNSHLGGFERTVPKTLSLNDLYKLAFRGLKARHNMFQLVHSDNDRVITPSLTRTVSAQGLQEGGDITVRIAEDVDTNDQPSRRGVTAGDLALIKVYSSNNNDLIVSYWVNRYTSLSVSSVVWKYWRALCERDHRAQLSPLEVWVRMEESGDGLCVGWPQKDSTKRLNTFLNRRNCYGQLAHESLFAKSEGCQTLVLKLRINTPQREPKQRIFSRLSVLKQMFEALINKILAYGNKTHVGLITFSSNATVAMPISHLVEQFRRAIFNMEAEGDTALYSALALAEDQVTQYGARFPDAKKRITCISDGKDTKSQVHTGESVAYSLLHKDIALDSICLDDESNTMLLAISDTLGCYKFAPFSLANALSICELDTVLSPLNRPDLVAPAKKSWPRPKFKAQFLSRVYTVRSTVVDDHNLPPQKPHPNLEDSFIPLADAARLPGNSITIAANGARSNLRTTRLLNEMRQIVAGGARETYDVYVSETDIAFWLIIMQGPSGSPYERGCWMLYLHAEDRYPAFAPKARFVTRIKHPNVSLEGRICHSIFSRDYTTDTSMTRLLDTVYGMLMQAEVSDPINTVPLFLTTTIRWSTTKRCVSARRGTPARLARSGGALFVRARTGMPTRRKTRKKTMRVMTRVMMMMSRTWNIESVR